MHSDAQGLLSRGLSCRAPPDPPPLQPAGPAMKPSSCTPVYKGFPFFFFFFHTKTVKQELPPLPLSFLPVFPLFLTFSPKVYKIALRLRLRDTGSDQLWQQPAGPAGMPVRRCVTIVISVSFAQNPPPFPSASLQPAAVSKQRGSGKVLGVGLRLII